MMQRIKDIAHLVLVLVAIIALGVTSWAVWSATYKLNRSLDNIEAISGRVDKYAEAQIADLQSPKRQEAIAAAIDAGNYIKSVANSVNLQTLPAIKRTFQALESSSNGLTAMIAHTDENLRGTLQGLTSTTAAANELLVGAKEDLAASTLKVNEAISSANVILQDPSIPKSLASLASSSENLAYATVSVKDTLAAGPPIAADLKKFVSAQSKVSKVVSFFRIASAAAGLGAILK